MLKIGIGPLNYIKTSREPRKQQVKIEQNKRYEHWFKCRRTPSIKKHFCKNINYLFIILNNFIHYVGVTLLFLF